MGKLAYLFPAFPVFHQTFVLWEVLGLRRIGLNPRMYSLKPGTERQQPEAAELANEVTYLPALGSAEVRAANWRLLRRHPLTYLGLFVSVFRAWQTGEIVSEPPSQTGARPLPLRDRLRGWYNRQPYLYLLKSWVLVPQGVELAERLQRDGITHLHVHWATYPTTVAYVVKLISGIPFSFSAHAYDIYMISRMLPAKIGAARFVATCARANAAFLSQLARPQDRDRIHVIYHGVDVHRFLPVPRSESQGRPLKVVSCGQLERYKGFHQLIDACGRLKKEGIAVDCRIVGEGPWRGYLEEQIATLDLGGSVVLMGALPHTELAAMLAEADVFALASEIGGKSGRRDVIANVLVEAMAAGLPVIASRIPGAEELIVDGDCGFLIEPNRIDQLAEALKRLAVDPALRERLGAAARERVLRDFDNSKNIRTMAIMLQEATDDGARQRVAAVG